MSREVTDQVAAELDRTYPPQGWQIVVHKPAEDGRFEPVAGSAETAHAALHALAAEAANTHHVAVVAEATAVGPDAPTGGVASCIAVPVFDPEVFDPDPKARPLSGIVTLASKLPVEVVIHNGSLRTDVHRLTERLVLDTVRSA